MKNQIMKKNYIAKKVTCTKNGFNSFDFIDENGLFTKVPILKWFSSDLPNETNESKMEEVRLDYLKVLLGKKNNKFTTEFNNWRRKEKLKGDLTLKAQIDFVLRN